MTIKEISLNIPSVKLAEIIIENTIKPEVTLIFKLYNSKKNCITQLRLSNKHYYDNFNKFSLSHDVNDMITNIIKLFESNFIDNGHIQSVCN